MYGQTGEKTVKLYSAAQRLPLESPPCDSASCRYHLLSLASLNYRFSS
jgi:hypothetical protein